MTTHARVSSRRAVEATMKAAEHRNPGVVDLLDLYERLAKIVDLEFAIEADSVPPVQYLTADSTLI